MSYLLEIGADAMYKTGRRGTALSHASALDGNGQLQHSSSGTKPAADTHYSNNKPSCGVNTPLHWASYKGHLDVLLILLHAGYSIEDADPIGNRCLHLACSGGHRDAVELLLANSASVDQKNVYGNRPLDLATDLSCRKLLLKFQSQTTCEWCKEAFTRIRRPSLCQHCHNIYCDARPCSSYLESSSSSGTKTGGGNNTLKAMRFCQECANEMGKAEQDLRSLLDAKLELIRHTLGLIRSKSDGAIGTSRSARASTPGSRPGSGLSHADDRDEHEGETEAPLSDDQGSEAVATTGEDGSPSASGSLTPSASEDMLTSGAESPSDDNESSALSARSTDSPSDPATSSGSTAKKRVVTNDEMMRALTLSQTDAEALYTAIEAAQAKAADPALIQLAKRTYFQLVAHVALQEEIKSLLVVRPIGVRSLVESLKSALQLAQREHVSELMLELAIQVIQSAEAECTLFGCHALCAKIELGSKKHSRDIARLEASILEAQVLNVNDKLLAVAVVLRDRLNAEILLEDVLLPFTPKTSVSTETGTEMTTYVFSDGTVALTLLQALELRSQKITAAVVCLRVLVARWKRRFEPVVLCRERLLTVIVLVCLSACARRLVRLSKACRQRYSMKARTCSSNSRRMCARRQRTRKSAVASKRKQLPRQRRRARRRKRRHLCSCRSCRVMGKTK